MKNVLKEYDLIVDKLANEFVKKYFNDEDSYYILGDDTYWVGLQDEDREVLAVGDYFFNLENIVSFLRYKYTEKEMFEYYDFSLEKHIEGRPCINIKNWKKLKNTKVLKKKK